MNPLQPQTMQRVYAGQQQSGESTPWPLLNFWKVLPAAFNKLSPSNGVTNLNCHRVRHEHEGDEWISDNRSADTAQGTVPDEYPRNVVGLRRDLAVESNRHLLLLIGWCSGRETIYSRPLCAGTQHWMLALDWTHEWKWLWRSALAQPQFNCSSSRLYGICWSDPQRPRVRPSLSPKVLCQSTTLRACYAGRKHATTLPTRSEGAEPVLQTRTFARRSSYSRCGWAVLQNLQPTPQAAVSGDLQNLTPERRGSFNNFSGLATCVSMNAPGSAGHPDTVAQLVERPSVSHQRCASSHGRYAGSSPASVIMQRRRGSHWRTAVPVRLLQSRHAAMGSVLPVILRAQTGSRFSALPAAFPPARKLGQPRGTSSRGFNLILLPSATCTPRYGACRSYCRSVRRWACTPASFVSAVLAKAKELVSRVSVGWKGTAQLTSFVALGSLPSLLSVFSAEWSIGSSLAS